MKHLIGRAIALTALSLGLAAAASAQEDRCWNARMAGSWGYTKTGTIFLPTGPAPFGSIGKLEFDIAGNVWGTQEASVGGNVAKGALNGTFTLNADCTGTMTLGVYDLSGNLLRTVGMSIVVDDKGAELRGLMTSLVLPNGMSLASVVTGSARKISPTPVN